MAHTPRTACLVLGDQLSDTLASLTALADRDVVVMAEVMSEATYVRHHKQKLVLVFAAMRHFAERLRSRGREVIYIRIDDEENSGDLRSEVERLQTLHSIDRWVVTEPGEWRLLAVFRDWQASSVVPVSILEDTRFLTTHREFESFLKGRKQPRMEHFYRIIRRKTGLLMEGDQPIGGQWNFDQDNRKAFKGGDTPAVPRFAPDPITEQVKELVECRFGSHFGDLENFFWPVNAEQAEHMLAYFIRCRLSSFGDYQDALVAGNDTLFHSLLSTSINLGLLDPLTVCERAVAAYTSGVAPINAVEGFVRQIIGWREYVRGLYWAYMPEYKSRNALKADAPLPAFFWDESQTDMVCMQEAIRNTRENAYAHHIQRLMVTGNFALLAGIDVAAVCDWYLAVYADAYEWVELPNTLGMALFGDNGLLASKPYCASGKYIDRMSNYCKSCRYNVKQNTGDDACPINVLYWDFLDRHESRFRSNPRMAMVLRNLDRQSIEQRTQLREQAATLKYRLQTDEPSISPQGQLL